MILLFDKTDCEWQFSCTQKGELIYSKNGENNQILLSNATDEFDLITDIDGNFHLVAQTADGNLVYLIYDFKNWKKYNILNSKSGNTAIKNIKIIFVGEKIHCFYALSFGGKNMLIHHVFSQNEHGNSPTVISYIASGKEFKIFADTAGNIHIFYFNEKSEFCYKIYDTAYSDGVFPNNDDVAEICPVYDSDGISHFLYSARLKSYYTLTYFNSKFKEKKTISFGDSPLRDCRLQIREKNVLIQWRDGPNYYECTSPDKGASFKKPTQFNRNQSKKLSVRLRSPFNPLCLNADRIFLSPSEKKSRQTILYSKGKKTENKSPVVADGRELEHMNEFENKLNDHTRELARLSSSINSISEKLKALEKTFSERAEKTHSNDIALPNDIGQINEENLKLFSSTDINDANFENSNIYQQ